MTTKIYVFSINAWNMFCDKVCQLNPISDAGFDQRQQLVYSKMYPFHLYIGLKKPLHISDKQWVEYGLTSQTARNIYCKHYGCPIPSLTDHCAWCQGC